MRCRPGRLALYAAVVALHAAPVLGGCALVGDACICTDEQGGTWDVTSLTPAGNMGATTTAIARGACSGTYCTTGFVYSVDFCTPHAVTSCYSGTCCTTSDQLYLYRTDLRGTCPPGTICQCDKLGDKTAGALVVTTLQEEEEGISIEFTNNA